MKKHCQIPIFGQPGSAILLFNHSFLISVHSLFINLGNTTNQVTLLWRDPKEIIWEPNNFYYWWAIHQTKIGLIRVLVHLFDGGALMDVIDSTNILDHNLRGGHLGCYTQGMGKIAWISIDYYCKDKVEFVRKIVMPNRTSVFMYVVSSLES